MTTHMSLESTYLQSSSHTFHMILSGAGCIVSPVDGRKRLTLTESWFIERSKVVIKDINYCSIVLKIFLRNKLRHFLLRMFRESLIISGALFVTTCL